MGTISCQNAVLEHLKIHTTSGSNYLQFMYKQFIHSHPLQQQMFVSIMTSLQPESVIIIQRKRLVLTTICLLQKASTKKLSASTHRHMYFVEAKQENVLHLGH